VETNERETELRKIAVGRLRARRELYMHVASYAVVNLALVAIWAATNSHYPWFVWPMIGWGVGVAFHAFAVLFRADSRTPFGPDDERAIAREVARLRRANAPG
jgi:hypothetical protein